jgi:oxygen-independent coproporphyrinogen-3 oxidase
MNQGLTPSVTPFGLYVHIPFCVRKCGYCNFLSVARPGGDLVERYLRGLALELEAFPGGKGRPVDTLYVGGGTPTLLDEGQLDFLFGAIRSAVSLDGDAEITVEANPGTIDKGKADRLRELGVNRVSLGVQSFDDGLLHRLGRIHDAAGAREAFGILRGAGFGNVSIDLIYGLPGQTLSRWGRDMEEALALRPEHLSLYGLTVEEGTPLAGEQRAGKLNLPGESETANLYLRADSLADEAGYDHYEISSWSLPGRQSRHNLGCWGMRDYYGAGAGAHSFRHAPEAVRSGNVEDVAEYLRRVEAGDRPEAFRERLPDKTLAGETLMLGLRLREGVDRGSFSEEFGADPVDLFPEALSLAAEKGWLERGADRLRLTVEGMLFSDEIFIRLF